MSLCLLVVLLLLQTLQLNGEQSTVVDTQVRAPPEPSNPSGDTIAAGAQWDEAALAKAVRFSRYASAFHGCQAGELRFQRGACVRSVCRRSHSRRR